MAEELKILAPTGMIGYSLNTHLLRKALDNGVDAMIADSGSTDSGPSKLALGKTTVTREAYENDLGILVQLCHEYKVPILIGSAGGDGSDQHVDLFIEIIEKCIQDNKYRPMEVMTLKSQVSKETVKEAYQSGKISPCGKAVPELTESDIDDATCIVGQIGHEPWVAAMQANPDFDIFIGGRTYDPAPFVAFCVWKGFTDLGLAYHMGKVMECGGVCATPKSMEVLGMIRKASFDVSPLGDAKCTSLSVAAHTLYEKTRPDLLPGPGGTLDVSQATYEDLEDGKSVRVKGAVFNPIKPDEYTIKLEGAKVSGYRSVFIGSINDPILGAQIDSFLQKVEERLREVLPFDFDINLHVYGKDHMLPGVTNPVSTPRELGIVGQLRAATQAQASHAASLARTFCIHGPYPGQLATAGNFQFPFAEVPQGAMPEFCIYHLMIMDDPVGVWPVDVMTLAPSSEDNSQSQIDKSMKKKIFDYGKLKTAIPKTTSSPPLVGPPPPVGHVYLASICSVLRSKNAGPYEVTIDVMFPDAKTCAKVKATNVLTKEKIIDMYGIKDEDVLASMWWDNANAFKLTMKRKHVSASFECRDVHGSGNHVPLMYLPIPWDAE